MSRPYNSVRVPKIGRSVFNLSHEKFFDCDMGQLIPVMHKLMYPGDIFKIANQAVLRFNPLVAPLLHEINVYFHTFAVPVRLLMDDGEFQEFVTGGVDGESTVVPTRWEPVSTAKYSLWDYLGYPVGVNPVGAYPVDWKLRAYNRICQEYYRDQNLEPDISDTDEMVKTRAWEKDYFTSALPWQQRGIAPTLPIGDTAPIIPTEGQALWVQKVDSPSTNRMLQLNAGNVVAINDTTGYSAGTPLQYSSGLIADLSGATSFTINELRLQFQIQRFMERNARAGVRLNEFIMAHFGENIGDYRIQRPEYVGGAKYPVIISEVLQTSSTDETSPQGNMAGHAIVANSKYIGTYKAKEHTIIMTIMSIMPRTAYAQGIPREDMIRSKYDMFFPEFVNLSEQAIEMSEIYAQGTEVLNREIFGYQGRFDEYRSAQSGYMGDMRDALKYWHLGRFFSSKPLLNPDFIRCVPRKDVFAVNSVPGIICRVGNIIKAIRPMPAYSEPGLIDHN